MRAAVLTGIAHPLEIQALPDPVAPPRGALVKTAAAGICRTDVHQWLGDWTWLGFDSPLPRVLGHEMAGEVVAVGQGVNRIKVGDRVTVPFHLACGECRRCFSGQSNLCEHMAYLGSSWPGAFAEYVPVKVADLNCVVLPDGVSMKAGAALGCRFMTAWHGLRDRGRLQPGDWVLVTGATGGVGLSTVHLAAALGAQVIAVDIDENKFDGARAAGATVVLNAASDDVVAAVRAIAHGGVDVSVDAVARAETVRTCIAALRPGGRHVQIGMTGQEARGEISIPLDQIVAAELSIAGVTGNPHHDYQGLLEFVRTGQCDPESLISECVSLDDVSQVFARMKEFATTGFAMITDFDS